MNSIKKTAESKSIIYGLSIILFPVLLFIGFILHPNFFHLNIITTSVQLANRFRHSLLFHLSHLIVTMAIPFIIIAIICFMEKLDGPGIRFGFIGAMIGITGAVILAVDKGALCLVLSAFDTLPDATFKEFIPFLQVVVNKNGLLAITYLLPLITIGPIIQAIGLLKEKLITVSQGIMIIVGLLLLNNPDIEIISSIGAICMMIGYIPLGLQIIKERS